MIDSFVLFGMLSRRYSTWTAAAAAAAGYDFNATG